MVSIKVDTREFDAAWKRYQEFNKRALPEIVNTKVYFIARNAVNTTDTGDKNNIGTALRSASREYHKAPLAAIIVNKMKAAKGDVGLYGSKMKAAVNKLINIRKRSVNFLRAGWIAAIRKIEPSIQKKSGAPKYKKTEMYGKPKGGASASPKIMSNWMCKASIWNEVQGSKIYRGLNKKTTNMVQKILTDGLQKAVNKEAASMRAYVERKLKEGADKFNAGK